MVNYKAGKIYLLFNTKSGKPLYVGSTTIGLGKRLNIHKTYARYANTYYNASSIHDEIKNMRDGVKNLGIKLLENVPVETRDELNAREDYWKKKLNIRNDNHALKIENNSDIQRALKYHQFKLRQYKKRLERNKKAIKYTQRSKNQSP